MHVTTVGRRTVALSIAAGLIGLIGASPASAAVTIGNKLQTGTLDNGPGCNGVACTVTTRPPTGTQTIEAPGGLLSPIDGVVTSWRVATDSSGNQVSLRVLRPGGGLTATGAGTSSQQTTVGGISGPFLTQLPIRTGDAIGVNASNGTLILRPTAQASSTYWNPFLPDNSTALGSDSNSRQTMVEATVEPDCDADGLGDETQDPDTSSCNPPAPKSDRTLTLDANKGKVEKGRKVRLSGQIDAPQNEGGCEPNQAVELQRKAKNAPDAAFATFRTVQTDQAGNFADKVKVKKTRIYRAVVAETEACDDETSNSQKVRVQKKKAAQEA